MGSKNAIENLLSFSQQIFLGIRTTFCCEKFAVRPEICCEAQELQGPHSEVRYGLVAYQWNGLALSWANFYHTRATPEIGVKLIS